jgi:hypothetical protein
MAAGCLSIAKYCERICLLETINHSNNPLHYLATGNRDSSRLHGDHRVGPFPPVHNTSSKTILLNCVTKIEHSIRANAVSKSLTGLFIETVWGILRGSVQLSTLIKGLRGYIFLGDGGFFTVVTIWSFCDFFERFGVFLIGAFLTGLLLA